MGTDLITISNHRIDYADFDFDRLGREVAARLNQTRLENPEFYWLSRLYWENFRPPISHVYATRLLVPWTHDNDEYHRTGFYDNDSWMRGQLSFSGPFGWDITVEPGKDNFSLLPFRYLGWVGPSEEEPGRPLRTAYRKALIALVSSLGGNEVTYLADNTHPLESFAEIEDYATMRLELETQLGPPLKSLAQMEEWQLRRHEWQLQRQREVTSEYSEDRTYLVDDFSDLDWSQPITLPSYLQEFRDRIGLVLPNLPLNSS